MDNNTQYKAVRYERHLLDIWAYLLLWESNLRAGSFFAIFFGKQVKKQVTYHLVV